MSRNTQYALSVTKSIIDQMSPKEFLFQTWKVSPRLTELYNEFWNEYMSQLIGCPTKDEWLGWLSTRQTS